MEEDVQDLIKRVKIVGEFLTNITRPLRLLSSMAICGFIYKEEVVLFKQFVEWFSEYTRLTTWETFAFIVIIALPIILIIASFILFPIVDRVMSYVVYYVISLFLELGFPKYYKVTHEYASWHPKWIRAKEFGKECCEQTYQGYDFMIIMPYFIFSAAFGAFLYGGWIYALSVIGLVLPT